MLVMIRRRNVNEGTGKVTVFGQKTPSKPPTILIPSPQLIGIIFLSFSLLFDDQIREKIFSFLIIKFFRL